MSFRSALLALLLGAGTLAVRAQSNDETAWDPLPPEPPPGAGPHRPPPGEPPPPPPPDRDRKGGTAQGAILDWWLQGMKQNNPEEFEELQRLRRENPGELRRRMREYRRNLLERHARETPDHPDNRKIRELEREAGALAKRAREADPAEREEVVRALRNQLETLFDLREAQRARQIGQMEQRLDDLRRLVESRQANRDRIIDLRLQELTGDASLEW